MQLLFTATDLTKELLEKGSDAVVVVVDVVAAVAVAAVKGSEDDDGFLVQGQEPSLLSCRRAPSWQRSTWSSASAAAAAAWKNNASDNFFSIKLFLSAQVTSYFCVNFQNGVVVVVVVVGGGGI